jgi:hypothetical protein
MRKCYKNGAGVRINGYCVVFRQPVYFYIFVYLLTYQSITLQAARQKTLPAVICYVKMYGKLK